jgi:hypothetical protein
MLQLQQRAHYSLEEFRRGNINTAVNRYPAGSEPVSPDNDNDELAMLGGKTRLVAKIEPSSPQLMERSPNSQNPIVPLPLSPTMQHHLDPSVVEYLHSFGSHTGAGATTTTNGGGGASGAPSAGNNGNQMSPQRASFAADVDLSPVSMYGMSALPATSGYSQDASSFISPQSQQAPSQQQQGMRHAGPPSSLHHHQQHHHHQHHSSQSNGSLRDVTMGSAAAPSASSNSSPSTSGGSMPGSSASVQSFPQYFSVFDYGTGMMNGNGASASASAGAGASATYGGAPILDTPSPSGMQRRSSGSPEGNMQSTWQDFVMGLQMT